MAGGPVSGNGKVNLGNLVQHNKDLEAGQLEDPLTHIALKGMPGLPGGPAVAVNGNSAPTTSGLLGGGGSGGTTSDPTNPPQVPSYGSGSGLTAPGAHVTLAMLNSLLDPTNGAVLGMAMMALVDDAIKNRIGAKRDALEAGLARVNNALQSAANEALQSQHQRSDLEAKSAAEMSGFIVGMVAGCIQAAGAVTAAATSGSDAGSAASVVGKFAGNIGTAVGTMNGAYGSLMKEHEDQIELNSQTWADKTRQAHIDVLKAVNEGDVTSTQAASEEATDALRSARDMVGKIWASKKENMDKAVFSR